MHKLYELKEKLMKELEDYAENGKFSEKDVESIKYITSSIDHICNIMEDSEEYSGAYDDGMSMRGGSYARGGNYNRGGSSYARGRGRNARRDSMGRYSSRMYSGNYSGDNSMIVSELRELMEDAPDEKVRMEIENLVSKIERM